jgi:type II secretory pathway component PulF
MEPQPETSHVTENQHAATGFAESVRSAGYYKATLLAGAWLPFFALIIFFVPQFTPIFTKLEEIGELPLSTSWLVVFSRLSTTAFGLPVAVFFAVLLISNHLIWRMRPRVKFGKALYRSWAALVIGSAIVAFLWVPTALSLPVLRFSPQ